MKMKITAALVGSFLLGMAVTGLLVYNSAPKMMITETVSPLSHQQTVDTIIETAGEQGWKVPATHLIHNSVAEGGFDVPPVTVIELCKVDLAGEILDTSENRVVSSMMPCRVAVYEDGNGNVIVSRMNTGLMSRMFGGEVQEIMTEATSETEVILASVSI